MSEGVTHTGWRFGQLRLTPDLPYGERLTDCSACNREVQSLVQFRYCGTQGALCAACLRAMLQEQQLVSRERVNRLWEEP